MKSQIIGDTTRWYVCGECGNAVDPRDNYCPECGDRINEWLVATWNRRMGGYNSPNDPVKVIGNKHENEELWEAILGGEPFWGTEEDENWYDESSSFDWEEE